MGIDCLIATFCIDRGHALLHNDRDFDAFEDFLDLRVVRPWRGGRLVVGRYDGIDIVSPRDFLSCLSS